MSKQLKVINMVINYYTFYCRLKVHTTRYDCCILIIIIMVNYVPAIFKSSKALYICKYQNYNIVLMINLQLNRF